MGTASTVWSNHRIKVFREIQIFVFFGALKNFFSTIFGLRNPTFVGVILVKIFDLSYSFEDIDFKIVFLGQN